MTGPFGAEGETIDDEKLFVNLQHLSIFSNSAREFHTSRLTILPDSMILEQNSKRGTR
ncbi:MAG TPA: hypothetical protein VF286_11000 [Acidiphilium sp.]